MGVCETGWVCNDSNTLLWKLSTPKLSIKNMNLRIVGIFVVVLSCFGFTKPTLAFNQQDVEQLRATRTCSRCDLSGADLSGANLSGVNLRDANLSKTNLSRANLKNADLTGVNLEGAVLEGANLSNATLTGANLRSAMLENANLAFTGLLGANLEAANMRGAQTQFTNFRGANFRLTTLSSGVVTSDKLYWWSLQRGSQRDCNTFKPENTLGTTCYTE